MKLAMLSHVIPPMPSGQSVMLGRLLQAFEQDEVVLLLSFREQHANATFEQDKGFPVYRLKCDLPGFSNKYLVFASWFVGMFLRAWRIINILRQERCQAIVACSGDILDLPAAYAASRFAGIPFYAYLFDDYLYQWPSRYYRLFVQCVEPFIMKRAAGIIVPNEFLRDEYRKRYNISCSIVRNPHSYNTSIPVAVPDEQIEARSKDEIRIVYSGAVYHVNYDVFHSLLAAIEKMNRPEIKLHFYTSQTSEQLKKIGITGPVVIHQHLSATDILSIQSQANILYLPLGFDNKIPELIRTSAPGKMGDYLSTGRPIMAHTPPTSFVSWYFRKHGCGLVVETTEINALIDAIELLLTDQSLRHQLAAKARERALEDFSLTMAQNTFRNLMAGEQIKKGV